MQDFFLVKNARKVKIKRTIIVNNELILYNLINKLFNIALQSLIIKDLILISNSK